LLCGGQHDLGLRHCLRLRLGLGWCGRLLGLDRLQRGGHDGGHELRVNLLGLRRCGRLLRRLHRLGLERYCVRLLGRPLGQLVLRCGRGHRRPLCW